MRLVYILLALIYLVVPAGDVYRGERFTVTIQSEQPITMQIDPRFERIDGGPSLLAWPGMAAEVGAGLIEGKHRIVGGWAGDGGGAWRGVLVAEESKRDCGDLLKGETQPQPCLFHPPI